MGKLRLKIIQHILDRAEIGTWASLAGQSTFHLPTSYFLVFILVLLQLVWFGIHIQKDLQSTVPCKFQTTFNTAVLLRIRRKGSKNWKSSVQIPKGATSPYSDQLQEDQLQVHADEWAEVDTCLVSGRLSGCWIFHLSMHFWKILPTQPWGNQEPT